MDNMITFRQLLRQIHPAYWNKCREYIGLLNKHYFRTELHGLENLIFGPPSKEAIIYFVNHAGNAFAWDAIILAFNLAEIYAKNWSQLEYPFYSPRAFVPAYVNEIRLMNPGFIKNWWRLNGSVDSKSENIQTLLEAKCHVVLYPEGERGIQKGWEKAYQVQTFRSGLARFGSQGNVRLVPITIVGSEWFNPFSTHLPFVTKVMENIGLPKHPLGPFNSLVVLSPSFFFATMPAKLHITFHPPIYFNPNTEPEAIVERSETLRRLLQTYLNQEKGKYGASPYSISNLLQSLQSTSLAGKVLPTEWASEFVRMYREVVSAEDDTPDPGELQSPLGWISLYRKYFEETMAVWSKMKRELKEASANMRKV
jgi:1-acyl-sn-glycerol-3-phosphate acyltransferase